MIGTVVTGRSFYHAISYVLEDKRELTEEQKMLMSALDSLQHIDRAEILAFHNCYGDKYELTDQFKDVARLSKRCEKPVLHACVRLAPGDHLTPNQLTTLGEELANEFGVKDNQYLIVYHKDTHEPHIHLVANRVGLTGKAVSDSNNYRRMADFCRQQEKKLGLKEVLSPRVFLSKSERMIPRHDQRKQQLANNIRKILQAVDSYAAFEFRMKLLGYTILKGRGISFVDTKKVKVKGSEVGFSLAKIERILALKALEYVKQQQKIPPTTDAWNKQYHKNYPDGLSTNNSMLAFIEPLLSLSITVIGGLIEELLRPEGCTEKIAYEFTQQAYERRNKKHRPRHH